MWWDIPDAAEEVIAAGGAYIVSGYYEFTLF
jgi:hypothetical protein